MAKEEGFKVDGKIIEILPNATFRVKLDTVETPVIGVISGKMRKNNIRILLGIVLRLSSHLTILLEGALPDAGNHAISS